MFYLIKFADSCSYSDHKNTGVCFSPFRYLFVSHSTYLCIEPKVVRGFQPPQILKPNKLINVCSCVVVFALKSVSGHCGAIYLVKIS